MFDKFDKLQMLNDTFLQAQLCCPECVIHKVQGGFVVRRPPNCLVQGVFDKFMELKEILQADKFLQVHDFGYKFKITSFTR